MSVSIWWSTLGHFEYTGAILLAWPGLLGGSQHNIFRTRSLSAGVASEVVVREVFFFGFHASSKIFPLALPAMKGGGKSN